MPILHTDTSRRRALTTITTATGLCALPVTALANPIAPQALARGNPQSVTLHNLHTSEQFFAVQTDGKLRVTTRLQNEFDHFMRDHYSDEVTRMDPHLIRHLFDLQQEMRIKHGVFEIISAYRSPKTNAMLRKRGRRVAKNSMHMSGRAIDLRLQGVKLTSLRDAALDLKAGGVGFYRASGFLHFDTGRVRRW